MDHRGVFRIHYPLRLLHDDDSCVLIADVPSVRPEMSCVVEQSEVVAIVGNNHPFALSSVEQLVRVRRPQPTLSVGRKDEMTIRPQGFFKDR